MSPSSSPGEGARTWVASVGGPLVVVPVTALARWGGCTPTGLAAGDGTMPDDYDRAGDVDGWAGVLSLEQDSAQALVLADEPARSCYLPEHRAFARWLAADTEADVIDAAEAVLTDPATPWEDCGTWETDGAAVLMDSVTPGAELDLEYPHGGGLPEQAQVPVPTGRWSIRALHTWTSEETWVGVVQLLPANARQPDRA